MAFDIPSYVRRAMKSRLVIQLHIYLLLHMLLLPALEVVVVPADGAIARRGCKDTCGSVSIPFPFGIGPGCFLDHWFEINCTASPHSNASMPKPFLSKFNFEVKELSFDGYAIDSDFYSSHQSLIVGMPPLNVCAAGTQLTSINLTGSPYNISTESNAFVMEGCPGSAVLLDPSQKVLAGCATACPNNSTLPPYSCYGVQCCQTPLYADYQAPLYADYQDHDDIPFYQIEFNRQASSERNDCLVGTLAMSYNPVYQDTGMGTLLSWSWISNDQADSDSGASCGRIGGDILQCKCIHNHYGNPYVSNGCQVPEDCKGCRGLCYPHNDASTSYGCDKNPVLQLATLLGLSISFGMVLLVIVLYGLYRFIKRRREMKRRAKFFKRNGGLLLQQQLSSNESVLEGTKIFTISELDKATDHFNENRILGQGGQGTVFKGMLIDGRIVAIKKAKLLDASQLEQFINEVVILSQINHRNVVKLLGCCLETEVPLLVYEFIPNGTLSQHIHDPDEDFVISWEMRLKIAADSATAIAYLHSSSSLPIYHRDIKSSNILLDEKHRARVSDFGSSKTIAIDQTHLTTLVQGTMGYLDPEYFQSYQFTEKSDVYSFGVVLLEILTGKNPIYRDACTMEQKNLVTEFLFLTENSGMSNILDPEMVKQAKEEELIAIVELAKCCVSWSGKLRPTMKEVAMTLEMIMKSPDQASTCYQQACLVPDEGFSENAMTRTEFMSSPLPVGAITPLYIDVQPLLPDTI